MSPNSFTEVHALDFREIFLLPSKTYVININKFPIFGIMTFEPWLFRGSKLDMGTVH